uniref:Phosphatidylinositol-3,4,5-trisphosphate 3-phosphatase n=1 Tax=Callithrix jacchus TaxID=9483 RepID=A0A5F4WF62_CALJA
IDESPHTSKLMVATQEHPGTSNSMAEQLSRFEDEEGTDVTAYDSKIKKIAHSIVSSFAFGIFGVCLLLLNVGLIFADLIFAEKKIYMPLEYRCISPSIAIFFLMDILLRVFVDGWTPVVRHLRLIILTRIVHLVHQKRQLEKLIRRLVSENKRRYVRNGFDLDLTYVTERIIAMSFPSSGRRSYYRNPIEEVVRFLDKKHPNHYRVYNLCSERAYDPKHFHNRVSRILIDDHNVPTLHEMVVFSKEASEWMAQDPENIIAIHCKGGKGRTGTMVCACLIASETFLTAKESLCYFGERRTDKTNSTKFQGVETPSQNRYVGYFAQVKYHYNWNVPPERILFIKRFIIYSLHGDENDLKVQIVMEKSVVFSCTSLKNCVVIHDAETDRVIIDVLNCPPLYDDVKVQFFSSELPKYYDNCPFFFWFHTSFIQDNRLYLPRNELDNPHKPKTWKIYPPEFAVEIIFEEK